MNKQAKWDIRASRASGHQGHQSTIAMIEISYIFMYKESTTQNEVKKIVTRASKEHLEINFTGKNIQEIHCKL